MLSALSNLGRHKIGHSPKKANISARSGHLEVHEEERGKWRALRDDFRTLAVCNSLSSILVPC